MTSELSPDRVVIVEPRCLGLEHVPFNAALIAMAASAYRGAQIHIYGDAGHLAGLTEILTNTRPAVLGQLRFHPLELPARKVKGKARMLWGWRLMRRLDREFRADLPTALLIATTDAYILTIIKARMLGRWSRIPVAVVFHEILSVLKRRRLRSVQWWSFKAALTAPHPRRLTYVVLSASIRDRLAEIASAMNKHVIAIDHPSLVGAMPLRRPTPPGAPLRFGFVGGGREKKGLRDFVDLAVSVRSGHPAVSFEVVGSAPAGLPGSAKAQLTWSEHKLPLEEFVERLRRLTHVVWLGDPGHYDLVASGSLVDAVALGIPVICLYGGFVDHLFASLGNIGIRCETLADVEREVVRLVRSASNLSTAEHERAGARTQPLLPETWAPVLRDALERSR